MKPVVVVGLVVLAWIGWIRVQQYRRCLPLPGATSVTVYALSPLPDDSTPDTIPKGTSIFTMPRQRPFPWAARIDKTVVLGQAEADRVNALLADPSVYHENPDYRLNINARYAVVMNSKSGRVEVITDNTMDMMITRTSQGSTQRTKILFADRDMERFVKRVCPAGSSAGS